MPKPGVYKFGALLGVKIEPEELQKFITNSEACKSTKDIVLRELVYAFNRYCEAEGGRFPVLQRLEIVAPGYIVGEDGLVEDASPTTYVQGKKPTYKPPDKSRLTPGAGPRHRVSKSA